MQLANGPMRSSIGRTILMLAGAIVIILTSFLITTELLNFLGTPQGSNPSQNETGNAPQMQEPAYDAAALAHLSPGRPLTFANGQNKGTFLSGWKIEADGAWSAARTSYLGFVVDSATPPKQLVVNVTLNLVPGKLDHQRVQVWSAGKQLAAIDLKIQPANISVPLNGIAVTNGAALILGFYFPDAKSPHELGVAPEDRPYGIFVRTVELTS